LAGTTPQTSQLKDPFRRFCHSAGGLLLEGLADQITIGGHFAGRSMDVRPPEPIQASLAKGGHVTLDSGSANANDLGGLLACDAFV